MISLVTDIVHFSPKSFGFPALQTGNGNGSALFEGQADHLIPSTSQVLLQSDLFVMAGRILGHSFLHGGPSLAGVSPAIVHVLLGGSTASNHHN